MSQFQSDDFKQSRRVSIHTEEPAKARGAGALFVSLLFFVPLAPLIGFFCGLAAQSFNTQKNAKTPLAFCAIAFGLLLTVAQGYVGYRGFEYYQQMTAGPGAALTAGFRGDAPEFASRFAAPSPAAADAAPAFIDELRTRFGAYLGANLEGPMPGTSISGPRKYELLFAKGTVRAEAAIALDTSVGADWLTSKLEYIRIKDAKNGDLMFPSANGTLLVNHPDVQ